MPNYDEWLHTSTSIEERHRPFLANGYIGSVISGEGSNWSSTQNHFMLNVWTGKPGNELQANIPEWNKIVFNNGTSDFSRDSGTISNYKQVLDMFNGTIKTDCVWTQNGKTVQITVTMFISRNDPNLAVLLYDVIPFYNGTAVFKAQINAQSYDYLSQTDNFYSENTLSLSTKTADTEIEIAIANTVKYSGMSPMVTYCQEDKMITQTAHFDVVRGNKYSLCSFVGIYNSNDSENSLVSASTKSLEASLKGFHTLQNEHASAWVHIWNTDIVIKGSSVEDAQKLIRSSIFYLLQNIRPDTSCALGPKGFSDSGWGGHVFWDTDTWIFPSILILHPDYAKSLLQYRYNTLNGAIINASSEGYNGAAFAWESGYSGIENAGSPFKEEEHISGDIVLAIWQYYLTNRDKDWLLNFGYPVICKVAEYIASRVTKINGRYEVLNVSSPDEYSDICNNDSFTNAISKRALHIAIQASHILGIEPDSSWIDIGQNMYIPFDSSSNIFVEFEGYNGQITKQAASELLIFPLEAEMSETVKGKTIEYYSSKMDPNGPCYSYGAYAAIYSELRDKAAAFDNFRKSYQYVIREPYSILAETAFNDNTYFCTGYGGILIAVIFGFAGLRIRENGIVLNPCLPVGWTELLLKNIKIGSGIFDIKISEGDVITKTLVSGSEDIKIF